MRITDASGVAITGVAPTVTIVSGDGAVMSVSDFSFAVADSWSIGVKLGATPGDNVFLIQAGDPSVRVTITGG